MIALKIACAAPIPPGTSLVIGNFETPIFVYINVVWKMMQNGPPTRGAWASIIAT